MSQLARTFGSMLIALCGVTLTLIAFAHIASAQTSATDGNTPLGLSPGAPAGSYALSDLDQIGLFNGGLNFKLPMMQIGGRGAAGYTMMLQPGQQSLKWLVHHQIWQSCGEHGCTVTGHAYYPTQNWWTTAQPGYSSGVVVGRKSGENPSYPPGCPIGTNFFYSSLTRITFVSADGTEYELRDQRLGGQPQNRSTGCSSQGALRGKVFVSGDGSSATFISDSDVYDSLDSYPTTFYPSGYLLFRDGTRYRIDSGGVSWIRDRNGNQVNFSGGTGVTTITDSLQRSVNISYGNPDVISFKGYGGAARTIQISRASLSTVLRPCRSDPGYQCFSPQTYQQLFPSLDGSSYSTFNPSVISAVTLPDGRQYRFYYNSYAELARVDLPTGGTMEYDYAGGSQSDSSGVVVGYYPGDPYLEKAVYRRIVERRVYPDGNTLEGKTTYGIDSNPTVVDHLTPAGQLLGREKHYFSGSPSATFFTGANSYPSYTDGREYKTEIFDSDGTTVLRRVENNWQQGCAVSQWSNTVPNNPHVADTTSTLEPTGANQVSKQTFNYDCYNNLTDSYEYDYGTGSPATSFTRHSHTDYLTTNPVNGAAYDALNPNATSPDINATFHIRSLPVQQSVYDVGGVERARTTYEYDNYNADANHASLVDRPSISGLDSAFTTSRTTRGNGTASTHYLLVNGTVTGSITAYAQFDIAGNALKVIDARGYATSFDFSDCYGAPDGDARTNTSPVELSSVGQVSYAFATKITNALLQTAYAQFDYYLGRPVDGEDVNGIVASGYYNDLLDRPTKVIRASNQSSSSIKNQTLFSYDDTSRIVIAASDLTNFTDGVLVTKMLYDGLGRTTEKRQYEGGSNYIAAQTQYDSLGRAYKSSNPFRPWQSETAVWTTSAFDALSRVTSVTTPDGAVVSTSYTANTVTVTDQTSKQRKSVTDGLGRLIQVYEDPAGLNYLTSYAYDTLDSLITVNQGAQTRSFVYDSLKRLSSATNPESGTVSYQYDNNGNLTQKTDARSPAIVTTYTYDALNRVASRSYQYDPSGTPAVTYTYDSTGISNGKGRLASVSSSVSTYNYSGYDAMGRVLGGSETLGGQSYQMSYSYDLAGHLLTQAYPSGHTANYNYDQAGRLGDKDAQHLAFTGNLGDGTQRNYATAISYDSASHWTREQFGTATPLYNKRHYNNREQLYDMRLSTVNDDSNWNRGAIINYYSLANYGFGTTGSDTNGNLYVQQHWIPTDDQMSSYTMHQQNYSYDSLNRIGWMAEYLNGATGTGSQTYSYDRYGNRTISSGWGTRTSNQQFSVDTNTNRLGVPSGQSGTMTYDQAGNLTFDSYSGNGQRTYDAENRMIQAWANNQWQTYTYDGDGRRVKRNVNGTETWQVYGVGGELLAEYAANASALNPQKEYGYRNGELLITADVSQQGQAPANSATFVAIDTATQGNWKGAYGADGYNVINDATSYPTYAQVSVTGQNAYTWAASTSDVRAPLKAASTTDRIAACWYTFTNSTVDVNLADGNTHRVAVYSLDWDGNNSRSERIEILDAATNAVLDTRDVGSYSNGKYSVWNLRGHVKIRVTNLGSQTTSNAVISGLFFDPVPSNSASFIQTDTTTQGNWKGAYGADGYNVINDTTSYPSYAQVSVSGQNAYTWAASTSDVRAPLKAASNTDRLAACWYSSTPFFVDVNLTDGNAHRVAVYSLDWDGGNYRAERIEILDAATNAVLDTRDVSSYSSGMYSVWNLRGHVKIKITDTSPPGANAVISGLFFDPVSGGGSSSVQIHWLVTDQLGTPRMTADQTGMLAGVSRHDYLPFGEELYVGVSSRTTQQGYTGDSLRQKFTQKERDNETGLDYFGARYYGSTQGRFTSTDPFGPWAMSQEEKAAFMLTPQQWDRYTYCLNNPLKHIDPTGLEVYDSNVDDEAQKNIHNALVEISKHGTKSQRVRASFILKNDVLIGLVYGDNSTNIPNPNAANERIAKGWTSMGEAGSYVQINIDANIAHPNSPERSANLEGVLVHEGNHAYDDARTISSLSAGQGMNTVWDPTRYKTELDAYHQEASYLLKRGGAYNTVGLDTNGIVNGYGNGLLKNEKGKIGVNEEHIRDILINAPYGVTKDNPGPTTTQSRGLKPPH
jgi:RHS repeat-associated protein